MAGKEGIGDRLRRTIQRLGTEAKRVTGLAQVKMQLNRLQVELKEREGAIGRKLSQLKRRGAVKDRFILEALKEEFETLNDCEKRIEAALSEIHGLAAIEPPAGVQASATTASPEEEADSDLNTFEVS